MTYKKQYNRLPKLAQIRKLGKHLDLAENRLNMMYDLCNRDRTEWVSWKHAYNSLRKWRNATRRRRRLHRILLSL